jgi:LDH2 family malate/lactate/ureidoglycolate dehydrogenase
MKENELIIEADQLRDYVAQLFAKAGLPEEDAEFSADCLVQTNLWGVDSHGVLRAPIYIKRMLSGAVNTKPEIRKINGSQALEVWHGDDGHGFVVAREAMSRAIELAEEFNVGVVGVVRSNHFGAASLYTKMAVEAGMVGIMMANVVPNIVAPGGSKPITGNNPIGVGIPTYDEFPFMLDISMSNVSGGKLLLAIDKGEKIPTTWATDRDGRPTDDPEKGFAGFLLPIGGHKGLGLSYMVDILSGMITGGVFQHAMKGMYKYPEDPSLTSHFMIVINLKAIIGKEAMQAQMDQYRETLKQSPMWDENAEMLLPGELEYRSEKKRRETGIPMTRQLYEELLVLAEELGVEETP